MNILMNDRTGGIKLTESFFLCFTLAALRIINIPAKWFGRQFAKIN